MAPISRKLCSYRGYHFMQYHSSRVGRMNDTEKVAARGEERSCANTVRWANDTSATEARLSWTGKGMTEEPLMAWVGKIKAKRIDAWSRCVWEIMVTAVPWRMNRREGREGPRERLMKIIKGGGITLRVRLSCYSVMGSPILHCLMPNTTQRCMRLVGAWHRWKHFQTWAWSRYGPAITMQKGFSLLAFNNYIQRLSMPAQCIEYQKHKKVILFALFIVYHTVSQAFFVSGI